MSFDRRGQPTLPETTELPAEQARMPEGHETGPLRAHRVRAHLAHR